MDWLRIFIAVWSVMLMFSMVGQVFLIGKPREPYTAQSVGCSLFIQIPIFVMLLLVWQRLGQ